MHIERLKPCIQKYAWGDNTWLQKFTGHDEAVGKGPWAELWLGVHQKGMTEVLVDGKGPVTLQHYIDNDHDAVLGSHVEGSLPLLFKILAVGAPLSIQCHPTKAQAEEGYAREDAAHVPLSSSERNYKDINHKPEILCAVTPFTAMCGFRSIDALITLLNKYVPQVYHRFFEEILTSQQLTEEQKYQGVLRNILKLDKKKRTVLMSILTEELQHAADDSIEITLVKRFITHYSSDPAVLAPFYLNVLQLQPGEALYQPAGELHAYVDGVGVELMANSDNVLRGGLTPKHVDVEELLHVVRFIHIDKKKTIAAKDVFGRYVYHTPSLEFILRRIECGIYRITNRERIELMIQLEGVSTISYQDSDSGEQHIFRMVKGDTCMIPAAVSSYSIDCSGQAFFAGIPQGMSR